MKGLKKSIRNIFCYAAAAGMAVTGTPAQAQDPYAAQAQTTQNTQIDITGPHNSTPRNDNRPQAYTYQAAATPAPNYPSAPTRLGDYERNLPLPQCERQIGGQFYNAKDVIRYLANPGQTPRVTSPNMSKAQIENSQRFLQTLGFDIADDGVQGAATTRAVMEFQMLWGPISDSLEITGVIDENLMNHLEYYARMAERDARTYNIPLDAVAAIRLTQFRTGADFEFLSDLFKQESTFRAEIEARTSSATGLGQHINRTWLKNVYQAGCNYGLEDYADNIRINRDYQDPAEITYNGSRRSENFLMDLRKNPRYSALMTAENSQYEVGLIEHWTGMKLTEDWQKYSVHFWGVDAGYFFWNGYKNTPNATAAREFPRQARANRYVFYNRGQARSYQQVANWFDGKFGTGRYREAYQMAAYRPVETDNGVRYAGQTRSDNPQPTNQQPANPQPARQPPQPGS